MRILNLTEETGKDIQSQLLKRSPSSYGKYEESVAAIVADVKAKGDEAVFAYTAQFDKVEINAQTIQVTQAEIDEAYEREDALRMAFYDFLVCVVEDEDLIYDGDYEQDLELIFDDVLQSVADLGLPVRRPMVFDDGDGGCVVLEYPYGCEKD